MMKKQFYLLLISVFFFSCNVDDFLDVKPKGTLIPESVEHFDKLMENPSTSYPTWANMTYMDPDVLMPDKNYNDMWLTYWKRQYEWNATTYSLEQDDWDWVYKYRMVYVYNLIINAIDNAPLGTRTEADRKRVKGEAYAQRALDLFLLVTEYAPAYSEANRSKPAIPMPLKVDVTAQLPRSTVGEVYDQLISDLNKAEELLTDVAPVNLKANFRPGKAAMKGLHALVNLHMGKFDKAKQYSDEALALYSFLYDYKTMTNKTAGNPWSGFTNYADFDYSTDCKEVMWNRYHRWTYYDPSQCYHPDLEALFDKANDQRWILHATTKTYYGSVSTLPYYTYARYYAESNVGITVPNLLLINAEACARTNDNTGALNSLNKLLRMRIKNFVDLTTTTVPDVLTKIKEERRKELMATGTNLVDLKRYHAYGETIPTFTRIIAGQTYTLEPGSSKYVVPISPKILSFNPNL